MRRKWTIMIYLAGDYGEDTSRDGRAVLKKICQVGSSQEVSIVVQFDTASKDGMHRFAIEDGKPKQLGSLEYEDSADPRVLFEFVQRSTQDYEAEHYALLIWGHGSGWQPEDFDRMAEEKQRALRPTDSREMVKTEMHNVLFRPTLQKIIERRLYREGSIVFDLITGHSIDTIELQGVLKELKKRLSRKIDVLVMVACFMSNLELAYQLHDCVKYILATAGFEHARRWPYREALEWLVQHPHKGPKEFANHIIEVLGPIYRRQPGATTHTALDLSKIGRVVGPLRKLALALPQTPGMKDLVRKARPEPTHFVRNDLADLKAFCAHLSKLAGSGREDLQKFATEAQNALEVGRNKFVFNRWPSRKQQRGGVTVYLPPPRKKARPWYGDLAFAQDTHWREMLDAVHEAA